MTRVRTLLSLLLLAALGVASAGPVRADDSPGPIRPERGDRLPDLTLTTADGKAVKLASQHGDAPLLLVFLHPSQRLCARFLEDLLERPAREGPRPVVVFSGDAEGPTRERALANPRLRVLFDPDRNAVGTLGVVALPSAYVLDRAGVICSARRGYTVSLARELTEDYDVALGLISPDELARRRAGPGPDLTAAEKRQHRLLRLAQRCLSEGRLAEALAALEPLAADAPRDPDVHALLAVTLHRLGRPEATAALRRAHAERPADRAVSVALAERCFAEGLSNEAEALARKVLASGAPSKRAQCVLGDVLAGRGDWEGAAQAYRAAALAGKD